MPSVTFGNHSNPRLNSFQSPSERDAAALALTPGERREAVARFFAASPGAAHLGRAVADFVDWQIRSGRIAEDGGGSPWWRLVNGHLVLDLADATETLDRATGRAATDDVRAPAASRTTGGAEDLAATASRGAAWIAWARCDRSDRAVVQARLWEAHQASLVAALVRAEPLLEDETADERRFARTAVAMVEHAAATGQPTDTDLLDRMTRRHYPDHYPATADDRAALEAAIATATASAHDAGSPHRGR